MQDQNPVHQGNDEQELIDPAHNHPQTNEQQIGQVNQDQMADNQLQDPNIELNVLPNPNIPT